MSTSQAYENLHAFQEESGELTPDLILDTHRILMRSSKINPEFTKYLNTGLTRTRTRKWVYITSANFNVQCCPPDEVDKELEYICRIGKVLLIPSFVNNVVLTCTLYQAMDKKLEKKSIRSRCVAANSIG